ncbi:hypothetical protein [Methanobrevibacter sp. UBA212]|uniref:hypothetical protein n=1 Tax=Methanobrevibacter sp. UBA212 TaxID=1915476 RepID=UPI0025F896DF|nr:hypothetical protein [Methanobrevibacter sp. UBA212]
MMILIVINVYLLIRVVSPYDFSGVLSMRLNGGENSGVNYLVRHDGSVAHFNQ